MTPEQEQKILGKITAFMDFYNPKNGEEVYEKDNVNEASGELVAEIIDIINGVPEENLSILDSMMGFSTKEVDDQTIATLT